MFSEEKLTEGLCIFISDGILTQTGHATNSVASLPLDLLALPLLALLDSVFADVLHVTPQDILHSPLSLLDLVFG